MIFLSQQEIGTNKKSYLYISNISIYYRGMKIILDGVGMYAFYINKVKFPK